MPQPRWMRRARAAVADRAEAMHLYSVHMSRRERALWASAQDMADLGELVIEWLEGRIQMAPDYLGPPDPETIPLVPVLAAANRAGFLTNGSQLGTFSETGCHRCCGSHAWVEGFAALTTLALLRAEAERAGLQVLSCTRHRHCRHRDAGWFRCPWQECVDFWSKAAPAVAPALQECSYVIVQDPEPGRNDRLWAVLTGLGAAWRAG